MKTSRRDFLKVSAGLSFAFAFPLSAEAQTGAGNPINAWVRIAPDGTVTIYSTGAEMGQGSMTSLPLILADEMDADWSKVKIEWAPADPTMYGYTFQNAKAMAIVGSRAVMLYYNDLRVAGRAGAQGSACQRRGALEDRCEEFEDRTRFRRRWRREEAQLRRDRLVRESAFAAARGR